MPVFHLTVSPNDKGEFELSPEQIKHWVKVRRTKSGETVDVWLPHGQRARAAFFQSGRHWRGKILEKLDLKEAPLIPLHLGVGWIRWPRLEWLVEKLTELGIRELSLLKLQNSRYSADTQLSAEKIERLRRISQSAAEQCERFTPLILHPPQDLKVWLEQIPASLQSRWVLQSRLQSEAPKPIPKIQGQISVFLIGPEGGFTENETKLALEQGFQLLSLGERVLRTETAALTVAVLHAFH